MPTADKVWPWRLYALLSTVKLTLHLTNPAFSGTVSGSYIADNGAAMSSL
jgi:hypothetical protein